MGMFWVCVRGRIKDDSVKVRGSLRTSRLRKKRRKHLEELYARYRDELFAERYGLTFLEWKKTRKKAKGEGWDDHT